MICILEAQYIFRILETYKQSNLGINWLPSKYTLNLTHLFKAGCQELVLICFTILLITNQPMYKPPKKVPP